MNIVHIVFPKKIFTKLTFQTHVSSSLKFIFYIVFHLLQELEKCESNHLIILFRDGGCQFRAIYSYSPDTEEIVKFTGTGPRTISPKMVDKLYKYSSDRKQFTVIPAKSVSVSVDALTIHNHLWQVKRPGSARRK